MCEFLLKGISKQTIVQIFFEDMLIFKKQSNIHSMKYLTVWHSLLGSTVSPEKLSIKLSFINIKWHNTIV